jgi:hypothetical protein
MDGGTMKVLGRIIVAALLIFMTVVVGMLIEMGFSAFVYPVPLTHIFQALA